jgi:hypothetical protein
MIAATLSRSARQDHSRLVLPACPTETTAEQPAAIRVTSVEVASRRRHEDVAVVERWTMLNEVVELDGSEILAQAVARRRQRPRRTAPDVPALRFAFYGRMSTEEYQDRVTSSA